MTFIHAAACTKSPNPTHGKWVDCSNSTYMQALSEFLNPNEVGGLFRSSPRNKAGERIQSEFSSRLFYADEAGSESSTNFPLVDSSDPAYSMHQVGWI